MKKYSSLIATVGLIASLALVAPAFAKTSHNLIPQGVRITKSGVQTHKMSSISGTVFVVSGTTVTLIGKAKPKGGVAVTYTVDAANAKIMKNGATSTISGIAAGDMITVQGTIKGSNVAAVAIRDGLAKIVQNKTSPKIH